MGGAVEGFVVVDAAFGLSSGWRFCIARSGARVADLTAIPLEDQPADQHGGKKRGHDPRELPHPGMDLIATDPTRRELADYGDRGVA